ncbi:MAG: hypothetical protein VX007_11210 [Pseudomonadota bacterium]|nr:hypothetical protein [Pseudomonadota bacterium]
MTNSRPSFLATLAVTQALPKRSFEGACGAGAALGASGWEDKLLRAAFCTTSQLIRAVGRSGAVS